MKKFLCSCLLMLLACTASAQERLTDLDMAKIARFGFGNILTGAWTEQDGWVTADALQGSDRFRLLRIWGGEACRLVGLNGTKDAAVISAIHSDHPGEFRDAKPGIYSFDTHTASYTVHEPSGLLTVLCEWEPQPRLSAALSLNSQVYRDIVKRFLSARGLHIETTKLSQLFKIDLEGDGVDEVLVCAQNIAAKGEACFEADTPLVMGSGLPGTAQENAYSVLFLRKIVGGKVLELPLHEYVSSQDGPPVIAKAFQFADLNGDGILEIITGTASCDGYAHHVFEVKGGAVHKVLSCWMDFRRRP